MIGENQTTSCRRFLDSAPTARNKRHRCVKFWISALNICRDTWRHSSVHLGQFGSPLATLLIIRTKNGRVVSRVWGPISNDHLKNGNWQQLRTHVIIDISLVDWSPQFLDNRKSAFPRQVEMPGTWKKQLFSILEPPNYSNRTKNKHDFRFLYVV